MSLYSAEKLLIGTHSDIQFEEECPADGRVDKLKDINLHQRLSLKNKLSSVLYVLSELYEYCIVLELLKNKL